MNSEYNPVKCNRQYTSALNFSGGEKSNWTVKCCMGKRAKYENLYIPGVSGELGAIIKEG
jgi:hypothetical protein